MIPDATIVSKTRLYDGEEQIEWTWVGGNVAAISQRTLFQAWGTDAFSQKDDLIQLGSLRLRVVAREEPLPWNVLVMRDGWKARTRKITYSLVKTIDLVYRRLVATAAVWGLASINEGTIPTWKDVYLLKKIADKVKR